MYLFLSYAREDRELAETIHRALVTAGFDCFFDTASLPPGQEYNARIAQAVARADLFVFLLSAPALEPGSYALTELAFAEKKWPNPAGHVLPVSPPGFDLSALPAYLRSINVLQVHGNTAAEVLDWVRERVERGGGGGDETPDQRLERWMRLNQAPLRRARKLPFRFLVGALFGFAFIGFGFLAANLGSSAGPRPSGFDAMVRLLTFLPMIVGAGVILYSIVQLIRGIVGAAPVAALVLDRNQGKGAITVHLLFKGNKRRACSAVGRTAMSVYPGEIGWAFVAGKMLLDFDRGPQGIVSPRMN